MRRIRRDDGRDVGGVDDSGALRAQNGDGVLHHRFLRVVEAAVGAALGRRRDGIVVERARDADARPFERVALQISPVVASGRRRAHVFVAASLGSGAALSSAPSRIAASVTDLAIGPGVSWSAAIGITP